MSIYTPAPFVERDKTNFKWSFYERFEGEWQAITNLRTSPEFIHALTFAASNQLTEAQSSLKKYVEEHPYDYLGFYLLSDLCSLNNDQIEQANSYNEASLLLKPKNNLNSFYKKGCQLSVQKLYREACKQFLQADDECYLHSRTIEKMLEETLQEEKRILSEKVVSEVTTTKLELEFEEGDWLGFDYDLDSKIIDTSHKKPAELIFLDLLWNIALGLIDLEEDDSAIWFLQRCCEIAPDCLEFKLFLILVKDRSGKSSNFRQIVLLKKRFTTEDTVLLQSKAPQSLLKMIECFKQDVSHAGKCFGFCDLINGIKLNNERVVLCGLVKNPKSLMIELAYCELLIEKKIEEKPNVFVDVRLKSILLRYGQNKNFDALMLLCQFYYGKGDLIGFEEVCSKLTINNAETENRLALSRMYNEFEMYSEANQILNSCHDLTLQSAEEFLFREESAITQLGLKEYKSALEYAILNWTVNPTHTRNNLTLGITYLQLGEFDKCKELLNEVIKDGQYSSKAYFWLGELELKLSNPDQKAEYYFEQSLEINPNNWKCVLELGRLKFKQDLFDDSILQLNKIVKGSIREIDAYKMLSEIYRIKLNFSQLIEVLKAQFSVFPNQKLRISKTIGDVYYYNLKNKQNSTEWYSQYLKFDTEGIDQDQLEVNINQAKISYEFNQPEDSLKFYLTAHKLDQGNEEILAQIAQINMDYLRYEKGMEYLEKLLELNPNNDSAQLSLAEYKIFQVKDYFGAISILVKLKVKQENYIKLNLLLAIAYKKNGMTEKGKKTFELVLSKEKENFFANLQLGFIHFEEGDFEAALSKFKLTPCPPKKLSKYLYCKAICIDQINIPSDRVRKVTEASIYFQFCAFSGNGKYFNRAIENILEFSPYKFNYDPWIEFLTEQNKLQKSENKSIDVFIGKAYMLKGNSFKKAKKILNNVYKADKSNIYCKVLIASCQFTLTNDKTKAKEQIKLLEEQNSSEFKEYQFFKVKVLIELGEYDDAMIIIEKMLTRLLSEKDYFEAIYQLGRILFLKGENEKGFLLLKEHKDHAPSVWLMGVQHLKLKSEMKIITELFYKARNIDAEFTPNLLSLGNIMLRKNEFKESQLIYEEYLKVNEVHVLEPYANIVQCLIEQKLFGDADSKITEINILFKGEQINYLDQILKGEMKFVQNKIKEAVGIFSAVLTKNPTHPGGLFGLARCFMKSGSYKEALASLLACIKSEKKPDYYRYLGEVYEKLNEPEMSADAFHKCINYDPYSVYSLYNLGLYYYNEKMYKEAQQYTEMCLENRQKHEQCIELLFKIYKDTNQIELICLKLDFFANFLEQDLDQYYEFAEKYFHSNISRNYKIIERMYLKMDEITKKKDTTRPLIGITCSLRLAQVAFILKDFKLADKRNKKLCDNLNKSNILKDLILKDFYYLRAQIQIQKSEYNLVQTYLQKSVDYKSDNDYVLTWYSTLTSYYHTIGSPKARKVYRSIRKFEKTFDFQNNEQSMIIEAIFLMEDAMKASQNEERQELLEKAATILTQCRSIFKKSSLCLYRLGDCYALQQNDKQSIKTYLECLEVETTETLDSIHSKPMSNQDIIECKYKILNRKYQMNRSVVTPGADKLLQKEIEDHLKQHEGHIPSMLLYVELLFNQEEFAKAKQYARVTLAKNFKLARMHDIIGIISYQDSDYADSVRSYKNCRSIDPFYPQISHKLAQALTKYGNLEEAYQTYLPNLSYQIGQEQTLLACITILTQIEKFEEALTLIHRYQLTNTHLTAELYLAKSFVYQRMKRIELSIETLRSGLDTFPFHDQMTISLANIYKNLLNFDEEISIYQNFLENNREQSIISPINQELLSVVHNSLANAYCTNGNLEEALLNFKKAYEYDATNRSIKQNIGICHYVKGEFKEALDVFTQLLTQKPSDIYLVLLVGIAQAKVHPDMNLAVNSLKKCLQWDPAYVPAAINLGILYRRDKKWQQAISTLNPLVFYYPGHLNLHYHLALSYYEANDCAAAANILLKVIFDYDIMLAQTNYKQQDEIESVNQISPKIGIFNQFDKPFTISYQLQELKNPTKEMVILLLSRVYRKQNRIDLELKLLDNSLKSDENNVAFQFTKAVSQQISNRKLILKETYERFIDQDPEKTCLYLFALSNEAHLHHEILEEIRLLEEIISLNTKNYQVFDNLGIAFIRRQDYFKAILAFQRSIELQPKNYLSHFNLANIYMYQRQIKLAVDSFLIARALAPNQVKVQYNLGVAFMISQNIGDAIECFEKCCELDSINFQKYQKMLDKLHKQLIKSTF